MNPIIKAFLLLLIKQTELHWRFIASLGTGIVTLIKVLPPTLEKVRSIRDRRLLRTRIGGELYTQDDLVRATNYYIEPDCQSLDPSGGEEFRKIFSVREPAHRTLEQFFSFETEHRFAILLADSGMGKTTLLLNFLAKCSRKKHYKFKIVLVPLGSQRADEIIQATNDKSNTVLLLDAFDEDTKAIDNHRDRLKKILEISREFRKVLISCRTQFFEKDDEVPRETGILRLGVTAPGQERVHMFYKIYLSPFSDKQIEQYIKIRFSFWHFGSRAKARRVAAKIPDLTIRPMLLANIQDILESGGGYRRSAEIYEAMIKAWLARERPFVTSSILYEFSVALAANIYLHRQDRGSEKIPLSEAEKLASSLSLPLKAWQLRGRSLLNRDADGNLKFSHRTIMEYLFICAFFESRKDFHKTEWTDQMKKFWWEKIGMCWDGANGYKDHELVKHYLQRGMDSADLNGFFQLRPLPITILRSTSTTYPLERFRQHLNSQSRFNLTYRYATKNIPGFLEILGWHANPEEQVVVDYFTGLMWHSESTDLMQITEAHAFIANLNLNGYCGHCDWRLPTVDEAVSLLPESTESFKNYPNELPFKKFSHWSNCIWTSDFLLVAPGEKGRQCLYEYYPGLHSADDMPVEQARKAAVRAVRSMHA